MDKDEIIKAQSLLIAQQAELIKQLLINKPTNFPQTPPQQPLDPRWNEWRQDPPFGYPSTCIH